MPPLLDVDGVAKKCDRIVLQGTQEVLKVRHDENEVTFTSNNLKDTSPKIKKEN